MTNQLTNIRKEIKDYHKLIRNAEGVQKDIYIEEMNNLIHKREEIERVLSALEETLPEGVRILEFNPEEGFPTKPILN
jgi:hypothetical protein